MFRSISELDVAALVCTWYLDMQLVTCGPPANQCVLLADQVIRPACLGNTLTISGSGHEFGLAEQLAHVVGGI